MFPVLYSPNEPEHFLGFLSPGSMRIRIRNTGANPDHFDAEPHSCI